VRFVALGFWILTACFGLSLLYLWLSHGGMRQQGTRISVFPAALIFAHPLLAASGLVLWAAFITTHRLAFAWFGFGALGTSAMLGFVLLTRWLVGHGGRHSRGAKQTFPAKIVMLHGLCGLTTFALVLVAATLATKGR
jgi:hypothetical protein